MVGSTKVLTLKRIESSMIRLNTGPLKATDLFGWGVNAYIICIIKPIQSASIN